MVKAEVPKVLDMHTGRDREHIMVLMVSFVPLGNKIPCNVASLEVIRNHSLKCGLCGIITGITSELAGYADCIPIPGLLSLYYNKI